MYGFVIKALLKIIERCQKAFSGLALKKVILFRSIPDFSESTVEIFKEMLNRDELREYKLIWFCDNPKIQHKLIKSNVVIKKHIDNPFFRLRHLFCESTAIATVSSHDLYGNIFNKKQMRVAVEHGSFGIKRAVGRVLYSDNSTHRIFAMGVSHGNFYVCGLPRNDRIFDEPGVTKKALGMDVYNKVVIWMPTFKHYKDRGVMRQQRNDYQVEKAYDITLQEDTAFFDAVNHTLNKHNMLLYIKYHPSQNMDYVISSETTNIKLITDAALLKAEIPLYSFLGATDALISDFSSVVYDYMLVDKPIGFDITDLELYIQGGTVAVENPLDYMPGEKIQDTASFCDFLEKVALEETGFKEERKNMRDRVHVHQDNQSAKRVVDLILSQMGNI